MQNNSRERCAAQRPGAWKSTRWMKRHRLFSSALGSKPRMQILELLQDQVLNVSEISEALDMPLSTAQSAYSQSGRSQFIDVGTEAGRTRCPEGMLARV